MWSVLNSPDKCSGCNRFLIFGANKSGKTSLAFRMSYEVAAQGSTVLFVCRQSTIPSLVSVIENLEGRGHLPNASSSWSPIVLSHIQFKYVKNAAEMKRLFASIHMMHPKPQCIAVDDFTLVIDPLSAVSRQDSMFLELCQVLGKNYKILDCMKSHIKVL
jgi:archaellum biogenesis ATPase FlaH